MTRCSVMVARSHRGSDNPHRGHTGRVFITNVRHRSTNAKAETVRHVTIGMWAAANECGIVNSHTSTPKGRTTATRCWPRRCSSIINRREAQRDQHFAEYLSNLVGAIDAVILSVEAVETGWKLACDPKPHV